jgi:hypothetical protein
LRGRITRERLCASVLVVLRRKLNLIEAFHRGRPWPGAMGTLLYAWGILCAEKEKREKRNGRKENGKREKEKKKIGKFSKPEIFQEEK